MYSNCEHFATECRYGQPNSRQVKVAVGASAAAGVLVTTVAAAGALLLRSSSSKDDLGKDSKNIQTKT